MKWITERMFGCAFAVAIVMALTHGAAFATSIEGGGGTGTEGGGGNPPFEGGGGSTGLATYDFTGDCLDCLPPDAKGILGLPPTFVPVSAVLVLQNYQSGNPIYAANLVSFTYNGSNKFAAYSIDGSSPGLYITGEMYGSTGANLDIYDNLAYFTSASDTTWSTGPKVHVSFDQGDNGYWALADTAVPEPASLALFGLGLLCLIGIGRRRIR